MTGIRRLVLVVALAAAAAIALSPGLEGEAAWAAAGRPGDVAGVAVTHAADDPPGPDAMPVSPELQIPLILKVLTYDRHFADRAAAEISVAIVYAPENPASAAAMTAIAAVFRAFSEKTVKNVVLRHTSVGYSTEVALARFAQSNKVNVFYITPGNAQNLGTLLRISGAQGIVTTTGVPDYVDRGVAIGIGARQDKPQILINLPSSRSAGIEFDASLLRIARVTR